ncbi:MAG: mechanosensitive ion channel family protein [Candidatus Eremiobacterota bacterium]
MAGLLRDLERGLLASVEPLGATVAVLLAYLLLRWVLGGAVQAALESTPRRRHAVLRFLNHLLVLALILVVGKIWLVRSLNLATFAGLLSAGAALVLREPILNLAGWLYLQARQPFYLGDRVQIGQGPAGDVVDIGLSDFTLIEIGNWVAADQSTGRLVHVPNSVLFTQPVANYTGAFPFIWNELPVTVTFESDWREACQILARLGECHATVSEEEVRIRLKRAVSEMIDFQHLTPVVWVSKAPHGITLTLRYLCRPRQRRSTESELWKAIFTALAGHPDIRLAYPTNRFFEGEGSPLHRC